MNNKKVNSSSSGNGPGFIPETPNKKKCKRNVNTSETPNKKRPTRLIDQLDESKRELVCREVVTDWEDIREERIEEVFSKYDEDYSKVSEFLDKKGIPFSDEKELQLITKYLPRLDELGDPEAPLILLKEALERHPKSKKLFSSMLVCLVCSGHYKETIDLAYLWRMEVGKSNADIEIALAIALNKEGRGKEAYPVYQNALDNLDLSSLGNNSDREGIYVEFIQLCYDLGRYKKCLEYCEKGRALKTGKTKFYEEAEKACEFHLFRIKGVKCINQKKYNEAIAFLEYALKNSLGKEKWDKPIRGYLSSLYYRLACEIWDSSEDLTEESVKKAIKFLTGSLDYSPIWQSFDLLIDCCFANESFKAAIEYSKRALSSFPDMQGQIYDRMGKAYFRIGNYRDAYKYFLESSKQTESSDVLYHAAICARKLGRYAEMLQHLERSIQIKPLEYALEMHLEYGIRLYKNKQYGKAAEVLRKHVIFTKLQNPEAIYFYGVALSEQGKYLTAKDVLVDITNNTEWKEKYPEIFESAKKWVHELNLAMHPSPDFTEEAESSQPEKKKRKTDDSASKK